jgi:two-component sensor histidine kinase
MIRVLHRWALNERTPFFQWTFAASATLLALAVRLLVDGYLPPGFPYLTFFPAVILTTFFAGVRPGLVTGVVCGMLAWYFFIAPVNSFALTSTSAVALAFYAFIILTDVGLIYVMALALHKLAEERARSDWLAESRQLMFRELQHRVSNNLAVVASLIKMQRRNVRDEKARAVLNTAAGLLNLIARIQRELHDPGSQSVDISRVIQDLAEDVVEAAAVAGRVSTAVEADRVVVDSERAIPIALVATELIANAVEHAFAGETRGVIDIRLADIGDGRARLRISDDGAGLPEDFDLASAPSLGLTIARQLAEQIGGTLTIERADRGTLSELVFEMNGVERDPERDAAGLSAASLALPV